MPSDKYYLRSEDVRPFLEHALLTDSIEKLSHRCKVSPRVLTRIRHEDYYVVLNTADKILCAVNAPEVLRDLRLYSRYNDIFRRIE